MKDLWQCTMAGSSLFLPETRAWFHGLRAGQRQASSLYLTEPGGDFNLPFGRWGDPPFAHIEDMHTQAPVLIHMAPAGVTAADLALAASRALLRAGRVPSDAAAPASAQGIDVIIYCHATTNEDIGEAIAGRLQQELGLATPLVFCLSQNLCSAPLAIRLATSLLKEDPSLQRALIVASEKWVFPFVRSFGDAALFEDGAAAVLIERPGRPGWQIGEVYLINDCAAPSPFDSTVPAMMQLMVAQAPRAIHSLLEGEALSPDDLDFAVLPCLSSPLCEAVLEAAGLGHLRCSADATRRGHLAAAEPLANLHFVHQAEAALAGQLGLLWSVGLQGEAACCLIRQPEVTQGGPR